MVYRERGEIVDKTGICTLKLEKINKSSNATSEELNEAITKKATFSIVDFGLSGNKQILTKEVCEKAKDTIIGKPLKCQYIPSDNLEEMNDDFDGHNEVEKVDRDGETYIGSMTYAIGVCTNAYIGTTTNDEGEEIECLLADYDLWYSDYPSEVKLMFDFYEKGEALYSSCEYYYTSYDISEDGYEMPKDICFSGHVILGSRSNKVDPAYTSSKLQSFNNKWNKAINSLKSHNKEEDKMSKNEEWLKIINSLSHGELQDKLHTELSKNMVADEYFGVWISDYNIYDDYFVYEKYDNEEYHYYKVNYTKTENDITIDYANKQEVTKEKMWIPVEEVNKVENSLKEANAKIEDLEKELENAKLEKSNNQNLVEDYNKLSDKVVSLNALVEQMKPIVDKHNKEVYEKALNEAKTKYEEKFKGVNALEVFEEDTTQELIKQSLDSDENISKNAIFSLNKLIVDNVKAIEEEIKDEDDFLSENMNISINSITETSKNEGSLIPEDEDTIIKEKYGINY